MPRQTVIPESQAAQGSPKPYIIQIAKRRLPVRPETILQAINRASWLADRFGVVVDIYDPDRPTDVFMHVYPENTQPYTHTLGEPTDGQDKRVVKHSTGNPRRRHRPHHGRSAA